MLERTGVTQSPTLFALLRRAIVVAFALCTWACSTLLRVRTGPEGLRRTFERLGPIYVKLGQLIASGEALFPERYSEEFRSLLDRVKPLAWKEIEATLREELGSSARGLFSELDREPIASASIAQVHAATLSDGLPVVVKVQRPGIEAQAIADLAVMRLIARVLMRVSSFLRNSNLVAFIDDFETNLRLELDFRHEALRMREFNEVMATMGNEVGCAPRTIDSLCTSRVLTMERFTGWRIDDVDGVRGSGFDPEKRLIEGIRAWFQTLILRGFFHGDVHAGNFMLLSDGRIGFLDFGIVGELEEADRKGVLDYVVGFQQRDFRKVASAMVAMKTLSAGEVHEDGLAEDLEEAFAPLLDPEAGLNLKDMMPALLRCARKHRMRMPRSLVLVTKQLVYLDRYSRAYGGANMNVLTDARLSNLIMTDALAAMFAA